MDIRLLAIDVDGTLLNDQHRLSDRTLKAISQAQEKGLKIILATGRGPRSCDPIIHKLGIEDPVITHNGAVVYHPLRNTAEKQVGFKAEELKEVVEFCRKEDIHFDASTAFHIYVERVHESVIPVYKRFFAQPITVKDVGQIGEIIVKLTLTGEPKRLDEVMPHLLRKFPNFSIIRSGDTFIDVMHPKATKAQGLKYIMEKFHLSPQEVMAFGNYYNDVEMLQLAGTGVAMENAPAEVKAKADLITKSNNEDGVAQVIERLLEGKSLG